jgi:OOP family OmpA-OmpF porin
MINTHLRNLVRVLLALTSLWLFCEIALAQSQQVKGVINGRNGATMMVQSQEGGNVTVLLTPSTQVQEPQGIFREKHLSMTALIPGLSVEVKGSYNAQNQLVADDVKFSGSALKTAEDIQAGLTPTKEQVQQNQEQIQAEQQRLQQQQHELQVEEQKTAANKAAIVAANKRFGELADYNILGEATVLFGNGEVTIEPQYKPQLLKLAQQAMGITGYVILVKGYASKVGSAALNQTLSTERAQNVANFLEQEGKIPLTNMLAPGAMGTSQQVAPDTTAEGQAENRRVVVSILQNKGIAGT